MRLESVRQRYWARATLAWGRFSSVVPNAAHRALAELERRGTVVGIITQNVDRLHRAAGSRRVVELHGALADVQCLGCGRLGARDELHARLVAANPGWLAHAADLAPDGDSDLAPERVAAFRVVPCEACGGALKPHVVFFGGSVPKATLSDAWELFDEADALLVLGSSLAVFSGFRFARRAAALGKTIAIVNDGPTRADNLVQAKVAAPASEVLPRLARRLRTSSS